VASPTPTTTLAFHNPLAHIHLHAPAGARADLTVAALGLAIVAVLALVARHRSRARARDTGRLLHAACDILGSDTTLSRHAWGNPPVRHNRKCRATVIRFAFKGHINDVKHDSLVKAFTKKMGGPVQVDVDHLRDTVTVRQLPPTPTLPARIDHPVTPPNGREIPFATALDGTFVAWKLASSTPHALVVGASGLGKSKALETIIVEGVRRGISVVIADPKRISLLELRDLEGVERYAGDEPSMAALLADVAAEIDRRSQLLERRHTTEARLPPLMVVIDEFVTMVDKLRSAHRADGGKGEPQALVDFRTIVLTGRQLRVHVLLATQRPDAEWVKGALRDQLGCRVLIGKAKDGTRRMVEIDSTPTVAARGRAIAMSDGHEVECQVWLTDTDQLGALQPVSPPAPVLPSSGRALVAPPDRAPIAPLDRGRDRPLNGLQAPLPGDTAARIAALAGAGRSNREIAAEVGVAASTVAKYRKRASGVDVLGDPLDVAGRPGGVPDDHVVGAGVDVGVDRRGPSERLPVGDDEMLER